MAIHWRHSQGHGEGGGFVRKAFCDNGRSGINEASRNGVGSTDPALEHRHLDRRRPMSRYGQYNDSWRPRNSQNGLDLKAEYLAPLDEEAEALYRLMEASKWLRPSVVVGLARASNT